jgi:hypothetical protein
MNRISFTQDHGNDSKMAILFYFRDKIHNLNLAKILQNESNQTKLSPLLTPNFKLAYIIDRKLNPEF